MALAPPPFNDYDSRDDLLVSTRAWAATQGYAIVIARSDKGRVTLKCDRGGQYRNRRELTEENRQRRTGSRLVECPFRATGNCDKRNQRWYLQVMEAEHNHEPSNTPAAHPSLRRLNEEDKTEIAGLSRAGVAPRTIVAAMQGQRPANKPLSVKDIYNARLQLRAEALEGRTPVQALVEKLDTDQFYWQVEKDTAGHVTHLFFAFRESLALYRAYPEVLLLDCTYKTNKFKMPLLVIIGLTGLNTSFYVAFVFLRSEQERDYYWALQQLKISLDNSTQPRVIVTNRDLALMNAISTSFPDTAHLLCQWHIQKNILAKCRLSFTGLPPRPDGKDPWEIFQKDWTAVIRCLTVSEYERQWTYLKEAHRCHIYPVKYLAETWIPWKEKFVFAWTHQHLHLGTVVTSRVESAHATLKKYLQVSYIRF